MNYDKRLIEWLRREGGCIILQPDGNSLAAALEELAKAQSSLAESERKCERLKFHAEALHTELSLLLDLFRGYQGMGFVVAHAALEAYLAEFKEES